MIIDGVDRIEIDGFRVVLKRLFDRSRMSRNVGQVVIDRRVLVIEAECFFQMNLSAFFIAEISKKTGERNPSSNMLGVFGNKVLVGLADRFKPVMNTSV